MTLADVIRTYRNRKGWSQGQLAAYSGFSQPYISQLESGTIRSAKVPRLQKLADVLNAPLQDFLEAAGMRDELDRPVPLAPSQAEGVPDTISREQSMSLGAAIRRLRDQQGWKQQELAHRAGISQGFLTNLETGQIPNPTQSTILKLAQAFDISVDALLQEAGITAEIPLPVVALQSDGLPESLVQELVEKWPELTSEEREAIISMHRAILRRYSAKKPEHHTPTEA